jgi:hypothetical protein
MNNNKTLTASVAVAALALVALTALPFAASFAGTKLAIAQARAEAAAPVAKTTPQWQMVDDDPRPGSN